MANTRISTASDGAQSDGFSRKPDVSPDGTKVVFANSATNLVQGDTNGADDIFVKDLLTGATTRVSTDAGGAQAGNGSSNPVFSPDGTKVAFASFAANLVPGDTNNAQDIFVKDLVTGAITRISTSSGGTQGNNSAGLIAKFSPDGGKIVFSSRSTNLVADDTNGVDDIFVKDLGTGAVTRVSTAADGTQGNRISGLAVFSPDGTKVALESQSSNLVAGDTNNAQDIFVKDLASGAVSQIGSGDGSGGEPVFSPDGTKIAFSSLASNITPFPFDNNGNQDVFIQDLATGTITRVSTATDGSEANGGSFAPVFSPDGSKIAFLSGASNLAPGDMNRSLDAFVKNLATGEVTRVPLGLNGAEPNGATQELTFSPDGTKLVIASNASNLVTGDTNQNVDIFVADIPCFMTGTGIRTERGDVAVEDLAAGDRVVTASGAHRPIRWLGHRAMACSRHPRPHEVMPVRIRAHAFGEGRPARDLVVSPGHAICVDLLGEVLIPAGSLVNGATIVQEEVERVTWWHVELEAHDILLAENLPCESYLEMGNRAFFAEAVATALHGVPDAREATHADFCRPFHTDGPLVDLVRERLVARATTFGWRLEAPSLSEIHLVVDGRRVEAEVRDLSLRFLVPTAARDVRLVSGTAVPRDVGAGADARTLGIAVAALVFDDGFAAPRAVAADDPRLAAGFHPFEAGLGRWTTGRACLTPELWKGCSGAFYLRVDLALPPLPRWIAPTERLASGRCAFHSADPAARQASPVSIGASRQ